MQAEAIAAIVQLSLQIILELINDKKAKGEPLVIEELAQQAGQLFAQIKSLRDE